MKLSFLPGQLSLDSAEDGTVRITLNGEEVFHTRSERSALAKFNSIREEMERRFPPSELSDSDRAEAFKRMVGDVIGHNSLGGRKKRGTAGSTRTFGG